MASNKKMSQKEGDQTMRTAFNDTDSSITVNGFLVSQVNNTVTMAVSTTTVANDTETYTFSEGSNQLYQIKVVYTDGTRATMLSATRIS